MRLIPLLAAVCRYDLENLPKKSDEVKARIQGLYKQFGKFHGISAMINLIITACAFSHVSIALRGEGGQWWMGVGQRGGGGST